MNISIIWILSFWIRTGRAGAEVTIVQELNSKHAVLCSSLFNSELWMHGWIGVCVKSRLLYDNASSCWVLMHHCSSGYPAVKDIPISQGKLARNNLPDHLEYFCVLICLWNCTSVCMCANMYKLTSICFQHLRAITYPPAKFGISAEIVPAFCIVIFYLFIYFKVARDRVVAWDSSVHVHCRERNDSRTTTTT